MRSKQAHTSHGMGKRVGSSSNKSVAGVTTTHDWLYEQGIDMMLQKEQVYQRFGVSREVTPSARRFVTKRTRQQPQQPQQPHSNGISKAKAKANNGANKPTAVKQSLAPTALATPVKRASFAGEAKAVAISSSAAASSSIFAGSMVRSNTVISSASSASRKRSLYNSRASVRNSIKPSASAPTLLLQPNASVTTLLMAMANGTIGAGIGIGIGIGKSIGNGNGNGTIGAGIGKSIGNGKSNSNGTGPGAAASVGGRNGNDKEVAPMSASHSPSPSASKRANAVSRRTSCSVLFDSSLLKVPSTSASSSPSAASSVFSALSPLRDFNVTGDGNDLTSSPRRRDSKLERLTEQVNVLKSSLGLSDDDLQWKVESSKGNAFVAADKHLSDAEERYERLAYETMLLAKTPCEEASDGIMKRLQELVRQNQETAELKRRMAVCQTEVTRLKRLFIDERISTELKHATTRGDSLDTGTDETSELSGQLEAAKAQLLEIQEQLKSLMNKIHDSLKTLANQTESLTQRCSEYKFLSLETQLLSENILQILRKVPETATSSSEKLAQVCDETAFSIRKLTGSRAKLLQKKESELAKATKETEIWKSRRDQSKEFAVEMAKQEQAWKDANEMENIKCLRMMRSLLPHDIQLISVESIIERAKAQGVLYTYDLAHYLKQNRFLHWLVTHESDMVRENFLAVESASFFYNFVAYDVTETRALVQILPKAFDFDKDGKKKEWRNQFLEHARALVRQQRGETIRAGWDPVRNTRAQVALKPLSEKQLLNPVFCYPTEEEITARLEKYELQQKRITQRKAKLQKLSDEEIPKAKCEYLALADDARSDELQKLFGKTTLIKLRDDAKANYQAMCKERDTLKSEVAHAEKLVASLSPTYDQLLEEIDAIRKLDKTVRRNRIRGPFPEEIDLKPKQRAAFKKLSVEEEAQARKNELVHAIAERERETIKQNEEDSAAAAVAVAAAATAAATEAANMGSETTEVLESNGNGLHDDHVLGGTPGAPDGGGTGASVVDDADDKNKFRRIKSLKVSVEVLRCLEKGFSAQRKPMTPRSSKGHVNASGNVDKPMTAPGPGGPEASVKLADEPVKPSEALRPKSHALMRMLEKTNGAVLSESESSDPPASGLESSSGGSSSGAPRPNFLQELQHRTRAVSAPSEKAKEAGVLPVAKAKAAATGRSFLDELKRRSQTLDDANVVPAAKRAESVTPVVVDGNNQTSKSVAHGVVTSSTENKKVEHAAFMKTSSDIAETKPRLKLPGGAGGEGGFLAELKSRAKRIA